MELLTSDIKFTGLTLTSDCDDDFEDSGVDFLESDPELLESIMGSSFLDLDGLFWTGAPCFGRLYLMSQFISKSSCSDGSSARWAKESSSFIMDPMFSATTSWAEKSREMFLTARFGETPLTVFMGSVVSYNYDSHL